MYSYNELNAVTLSPTKKDYYQIWNELLEAAGKLSERWNPAATNESDPGVVLLKVLTAVADKLNYNIDANSLEAFMPSAAQESSMRKLCDMLGYSMRYFVSATTTVRITYKGDVFPSASSGIFIDRFTNIKDVEGAHNFITLEPVVLTPESISAEVACLEGELIDCETNQGKVITLEQLDDNNRYFLPEQQIASNGIFISNVDSTDDSLWTAVENLNTQLLGSKIFKFGYDSNASVPYVQFPEDISSLIKAGLSIRFIRTKGLSGNVSIGTLSTMEKPASWSQTVAVEDSTTEVGDLIEEEEGTAVQEESTDWANLDFYSIRNITAAVNGKDPETIDEAYWNYQKTIGTFETLVTCRDYMNKVYQMTVSSADTTPLVSNIIVSDIRDDINCASQIRKMATAGAEYSSRSLKFADNRTKERITHFDLVLYPFCYRSVLNSEESYHATFRYISPELDSTAAAKLDTIKTRLSEYKTIAHQFQRPLVDDIACIKVYFDLSARITATSKITALEAGDIEAAAHKALYKQFNLRNLTFGEEIPFDLIQTAIEGADVRIKNVNLDDPKLWVAVQTIDGKEYPLFNVDYTYPDKNTANKAKEYYTKLIVRNILAGKIPLYKYNTAFKAAYEDVTYTIGDYSLTILALAYPEALLLVGDANLPLVTDRDSNTALMKLVQSIPEGEEEPKSYLAANNNMAKLLLAENKFFKLNLTELFNGTQVASLKITLYKATDKNKLYEATVTKVSNTLTLDPATSDITSLSVTIATEDSSDWLKIGYEVGGLLLQLNATPTENTVIAENNLSTVLAQSVTAQANNTPFNSSLSSPDTGDFITFFDKDSEEIRTVLKEGTLTSTQDFKEQLKETLDLRPATVTLDGNDIAPKGIHSLDKLSGEFLVDTTKLISDPNAGVANNNKDELVIGPNEVIQFRTQNLKTVATYPAYVNYFAKLDPPEASSDEVTTKSAIPATMWSLREFLNGGIGNYDITETTNSNGEKVPTFLAAWNREISLNEKLAAMPVALRNSFFKEEFKTKGNSSSDAGGDSTAEATDNQKLVALLQEHGNAYIKATEGSADGSYLLFATMTSDGRVLRCLDNQSITEYTGLKPPAVADKNTIISDLPIYSMRVADLVGLTNWLQGKDDAALPPLRYSVDPTSSPSASNAPERVDQEEVKNKLIKGLYTRKDPAINRTPGKLIDSKNYKYTLLNTLPAGATLDDLFVPMVWKDTTLEHTHDGLGQDALFAGIAPNTTYQLKSGEYILITYSTSEGRADDTNVVKNIKLTAGDIIVPNFELIDSTLLSQTKGFTKTSNYGPWRDPKTDAVISAKQVPGMFAFGPTEQIEVKEPVEIKLDLADTWLYWELDHKTIDKDGYEVFPISSDSRSYILKAGEYLFYTDSNKESMAYYGAGTEIRCQEFTPTLRRPQVDALSMDKMVESGVVSSIPWTKFNLSGNKQAIELVEYQIISLVEGDTIKSLELSKNAKGTILTSDYLDVNSASYISLGLESNLPDVEVEGFKWQVRTMLNIRSSADKPQELRVVPATSGGILARDLIYLQASKITELAEDADDGKLKTASVIHQVYTPEPTLAAAGGSGQNASSATTIFETVFDNLFVATNYPIIDIGNGFDLTTGSDYVATGDKLAIKACKKEPVYQSDDKNNIFTASSTMSGFTPVRMGATHTDSTTPVLKFQVLLPSDHLGMVTLLYTPSTSNTGSNTGIYVITKNSATGDLMNIALPRYTGKEATKDVRNLWWDADTDTEKAIFNNNGFGRTDTTNTKYYLRSGFNQFVVDASCEIAIYAPASNNDSLLIDSVRLVPKVDSTYSVGDGFNTPFANARLSDWLDLYYPASSTTTLDTIHADTDPKTYFRYKDTSANTEHYMYITPKDIEDKLREFDPELALFPIADDNEITLELVTGDTVLSPRSLFDKENANNKFVVSALNTSYLTKFVGISAFSLTRGEGL